MESKRKFFCPLPWVHLSLEPRGNAYTCCNASEFGPLGNVQNETLESIFQNDSMKAMREKFSRGEIPSQCVLCVNGEKRGQISLRESSLVKFPEINPDSEPKLKYLSFRFSNTCNYACRICGPELSTAWYKDVHLAGKPYPKGSIKAFTDINSFRSQIDVFLKDLEIIYLAGGEPLITPEVQVLLELLVERNKQDIEILINTNFSRPSDDILRLLKKFKTVHLDLSLDGMNERGEYMRHGMSWNETEERIQSFLRDYPMFHLKLFPTVSAFNVFHLSDFLDHLLRKKYFRPSDIRINMLTSPANMSFRILPGPLKKKAKEKLTLFKIFLLTTYKDHADQGLAAQITGLINALDEEFSVNLKDEFLREVKLIDGIRSQDVFTIFPELTDLQSN